ncbi:hypothetical protein, partial [Bradyrhizobium japonicum]|uniref:hypothetical protein n=1 Tax=Bradyrhizobium japonicum TaxID=375 RepID=UPI001AEBB282
ETSQSNGRKAPLTDFAGQDLFGRSSAPGCGDAGMVIDDTERPARCLLHGHEARKLTRKPERATALVGMRNISAKHESSNRCRIVDDAASRFV